MKPKSKLTVGSTGRELNVGSENTKEKWLTENREREREREREKQKQRERENSNSNSKNLFYKDCSLGSVKYLSNS